MTRHTPSTTLDPADPTVRTDAKNLAAQLHGTSSVEIVVRSMLDDVAHGSRIMVLRAEEEVTPSQAAEMLGVTRQFVDRLCEDGTLPFRRLPHSSHRRIRVQDVTEVEAEREHRRAGADAIRTALRG